MQSFLKIKKIFRPLRFKISKTYGRLQPRNQENQEKFLTFEDICRPMQYENQKKIAALQSKNPKMFGPLQTFAA